MTGMTGKTSWSAHQLAELTSGSWIVAPKSDELPFAGAAIDTRELGPNQFFFALRGQRTDGHAHLPQAQSSAASLCVISDAAQLPQGFAAPTLLVPDVLEAMTALASAWRDRLSCAVIGVTGSNGKTTTCRIMHSICAQGGRAHVSAKSFNNALGVPLTLLNTPIDARYLVAELGTSTKGEIEARAALVRPDLAIITSIGRAHVEALGDLAGVAKEKSALIRALSPGGRAFIPANIELLEEALAQTDPRNNQGPKITRLGLDHALRVADTGPKETRFRLDEGEFSVPLPGAHNASNAALCVLAARSLGLAPEAIQAGLTQTKGPAMRFESVEISTQAEPIVVINDAYNANPDSMIAALETFNDMPTSAPKTAVLGEMLELGQGSAQAHQQLAQALARFTNIDRFVLIGAEYEGVAMTSFIEVHSDRSDFTVERVAQGVAPGACVLIKGSRGVALERILDTLSRLHEGANAREQEEPVRTSA